MYLGHLKLLVLSLMVLIAVISQAKSNKNIATAENDSTNLGKLAKRLVTMMLNSDVA